MVRENCRGWAPADYNGVRPARDRESLAAVRARNLAIEVIRAMRSSDSAEIVPASRALFEAAFALYGGRADKDWGLTDCSSFVTMTDRGIAQALTVDQHFEQAGFRALL